MDGSILHIFTFQSSSENVNMWLLNSVDDYNCWDDTSEQNVNSTSAEMHQWNSSILDILSWSSDLCWRLCCGPVHLRRVLKVLLTWLYYSSHLASCEPNRWTKACGASSGKAASCDWSADWSPANLNPPNFLVTPSNAAVTQLYTPRCCCSVRSMLLLPRVVNAGLLLLCPLTATLLLAAYTYFAIPPSPQQVPVGSVCTISCNM